MRALQRFLISTIWFLGMVYYKQYLKKKCGNFINHLEGFITAKRCIGDFWNLHASGVSIHEILKSLQLHRDDVIIYNAQPTGNCKTDLW